MPISEYLMNPKFYDVFGIFIWVYFLIGGIYLKKKIKKNDKTIKQWMIWSLIIISVLGLIVDGTIVSTLLNIIS